MQLLCLSVSHHNAPVELRESLCLSLERIEAANITHPIRSGNYEPIIEIAILSTCNRLEVYALISDGEENGVSVDQASGTLQNYLSEAFGIHTQPAEPIFQYFQGDQVVEHLFQVAAGLDSIAIGETQILGQVSRTLETALKTGTARHVLSSLFRSAIHSGKRVRSETEIGRHPISIASLAVLLARDTLGCQPLQNVLVIGTGKMGEHTLSALNEVGGCEITLTNRTRQHAVDLARQSGGSVLPYEKIKEGLIKADVIFTSTASPQSILHKDSLVEVMTQRGQKPLVIIDLSVPRNVDAAAREIPNVQLFDMDDLQSYVKHTETCVHTDISQAKSIMASEVAEYVKLLHIIPFIGELHKKVEVIRQREVERALRNLHNPDPQVSEQFELFSRALIKKVLHEPTMHLRTESNQETLNDYVDTLARLFDLSEPGSNLL